MNRAIKEVLFLSYEWERSSYLLLLVMIHLNPTIFTKMTGCCKTHLGTWHTSLLNTSWNA